MVRPRDACVTSKLRIVLSVEAIVNSFVGGQGTLLDFCGFAASSTQDSRVVPVDSHVLTRLFRQQCHEDLLASSIRDVIIAVT